MFGTDYKREMDALAPSRAAMDQLISTAAGGGGRKPRLMGRRAVAALALCAALALTALAAAPTALEALTAFLGPLGTQVAPLSGSSTSAGVELEVVGVLSDGAAARFYLTAHDQQGGRLDDHTAVELELEGALAWGARSLAFDQGSDTLLLELEVTGLPQSGPLTLRGGTLTPNTYQVSVEPQLQDGFQTVQTYDGLPGFSASMGFTAEQDFLLRLRLAEAYRSAARPTAFVCFSDGAVWSTQPEQITYLAEGQDLHLTGITRENWDQVAQIWLVTSYTGPLEPIQGTWELTLDPVSAQTKETEAGFSLMSDGLTVTQIQVSPLGVVVTYTGSWEGLSAPALSVTTGEGGSLSLGPPTGWNWGNEGCAIWRFDAPADLADITAVTLLGQSIPLG